MNNELHNSTSSQHQQRGPFKQWAKPNVHFNPQQTNYTNPQEERQLNDNIQRMQRRKPWQQVFDNQRQQEKQNAQKAFEPGPVDNPQALIILPKHEQLIPKWKTVLAQLHEDKQQNADEPLCFIATPQTERSVSYIHTSESENDSAGSEFEFKALSWTDELASYSEQSSSSSDYTDSEDDSVSEYSDEESDVSEYEFEPEDYSEDESSSYKSLEVNSDLIQQSKAVYFINKLSEKLSNHLTEKSKRKSKEEEVANSETESELDTSESESETNSTATYDTQDSNPLQTRHSTSDHWSDDSTSITEESETDLTSGSSSETESESSETYEGPSEYAPPSFSSATVDHLPSDTEKSDWLTNSEIDEELDHSELKWRDQHHQDSEYDVWTDNCIRPLKIVLAKLDNWIKCNHHSGSTRLDGLASSKIVCAEHQSDLSSGG